MRRIILLFLFFSVLINNVSGQKDSYYKRVFVDAEYYLLYEEYRDALPLYLEILKNYPENANICYRIGQCYLNIPNEKNRSIPYFEESVKKVTDKYREGYFTESKAPREAFLLLGRAFRIDSLFDKALEAFNAYKAMLGSTSSNELKLVDKEIESIGNAKEMIGHPKSHKFVPLGRNISTHFPEINPVTNFSGNILVYTSLQRFYNAILLSEYKDSSWSTPVNINPQLFADGPISTVGMSEDGSTLVFARNDNDDFNLYISRLDQIKKTWIPLEKLPKEINGRSWETFGSITKGGDSLYFSSNKEGGFGGFDIYLSVKSSTGIWSSPVGIGPEINTTFDESTPFITNNGNKLFFCSKGHSTMGGYDIFVSTKKDGKWSTPINLGYPLNTTDDDIFYFPIGDGSKGFISRITPESQGDNNIYMVIIGL